MISITEEFDNPNGQFVNYDTNDILRYDEFKDRMHVDIRSFPSDPVVIGRTMYNLVLPMSELDTMDMQELEEAGVLFESETWIRSSGTGTLAFPITNGHPSMTITLGVGATVRAENVSRIIYATSDYDLLDDHLSFAFPNFPIAGLDMNQCDATVYADEAELQSSAFPFSGGEWTNDGSGNYEWKWAINEVPSTIFGGLRSIHKIEFNLKAKNDNVGSIVFTVNGIRFLKSDWTPLKLEMDTKMQRLTAAVTRFGTEPTGPGTDFPHVWRAATPPGVDDPRPINSRLAVNFCSGEDSDTNQIKIYTRGRREDFLTQLDLDGLDDGTISSPPSVGDNQWSLEQSGRQPDYGQARYNPRPQQDLDTLTQADLSEPDPALNQAQMERIADLISESWIEITLDWDTTATVTIGTTETTNDDDRYIFESIAIDENTEYVLLIDTEDNSVRVQIVPVVDSGQIDYNNKIFDSQKIINDFVFFRRKGRIGYEIDLASPNAWIGSIRTRGLMFGEFITNNYESMTPVVGAQIFSGGSSDLILTQGLEELGVPGFEVDTHNSQSADGALKITGNAREGAQSVLTDIQDFTYTEVHFDLYFPKAVLLQGGGLDAGLFGQRGNIISLLLPELVGDQWQHCRIPLIKAAEEQTGGYNFYIAAQSPTTWWVDNFKIVQKTVAWSGRAASDDAWDRFGDSWTNFNQMINNSQVGGLFSERGRTLQVRGQTLVSSANIDKVYIKPKYAELGRLVWDIGRRYR